MSDLGAVNGKRTEVFGVPWEDDFGYVQALLLDGTIYISGQLSHDERGNLVAPATMDAAEKPIDFTSMEAQLRRTYQNTAELLSRFGAGLQHIVEETLFVIDLDAAFPAASKVRKEMYGNARPQVASSIVGVSRLAFPQQLVEITFRAVLGQMSEQT
jgi:enamine deaminase RidA (YjgF/YER057c/UK114 family)